MKKYLSMVKRWDIIIILSLCILSFLPIAIFSYVKASEPAPATEKKSLLQLFLLIIKNIRLLHSLDIKERKALM